MYTVCGSETDFFVIVIFFICSNLFSLQTQKKGAENAKERRAAAAKAEQDKRRAAQVAAKRGQTVPQKTKVCFYDAKNNAVRLIEVFRAVQVAKVSLHVEKHVAKRLELQNWHKMVRNESRKLRKTPRLP